MSKTMKIKRVTKELLEDYVLPTGRQEIAQVVKSWGRNLQEVQQPSGIRYLVSIPSKYRKTIWIKRGDFVIVERSENGGKVQGEIERVLYRDHINYIKKEKMWPKAFGGDQPKGDCQSASLVCSHEDDDSDLFVNTNYPTVTYESNDC
ncbi:hypothetical protein HPB50_019433 [Hyalomma asiaticum]|uniref:Uncharacterized protein n=1 Tax=Hyalomma asiaticum TaxID=266040 RepID=A0ACB7RVK5_HYAAI|nr:hypothetical protein HPB50_019433 [Hyalomma asiaticum]